MDHEGMTDAQLLRHFVDRSDEAAFRGLVQRHGPAVLRACRRYFSDLNDVEDVYQATLLVLFRKASTIRDPALLRSWLQGVARRIAARASRGAARRRAHEAAKAGMSQAGVAERPWDDLGQEVRRMLDGLPEPYRAALELCYLRDRSHEDAATELGWPLGTLKVRLVRGRKLLRERMDRRGISLGSALLFWPFRHRTVRVRGRSTGKAPRPRAAGRGPGAARGPTRRGGVTPVSCALVALLFLMLGTTWGAKVYGNSREEAVREYASLPASLTDVLNVKCR